MTRRKRPPQVGTIGGLIAQELRLTIYCDVRECHHSQTLDLEALARELRPGYRLADFVARSRCTECGAKSPRLSVRVGIAKRTPEAGSRGSHSRR